MAEPEFVKVAETGDLSPGEMMAVEVGNRRVLLANVDGQMHAVDDTCSHAYASLSDGDLAGEEVECPLHGATFDLRTGEALTPPASDNVKVHQVRVEGQDILLGLSPD